MGKMIRGLRKLNNERGASLGEMLVTVLILALVTGVIAGGSTTVLRVYRQVRLKADAQTLLSTSINAMTADLIYASEVVTDGGVNRAGVVQQMYLDSGNCYVSFANDTDGTNGPCILRKWTTARKVGTAGSGQQEQEYQRPLVTEATQPLGLYAELDGNAIRYDGQGCFSFFISVYSADHVAVEQHQEVVIRSSLLQ